VSGCTSGCIQCGKKEEKWTRSLEQEVNKKFEKNRPSDVLLKL